MYISIDPGINYCSIIVNDTEGNFKVVESILINNNRAFTKEEKELEAKHDARTVKVFKIVERLVEVIEEYNIDKLIIEAPFHSTRTPQAYGSLLEVILGIKFNVVIPRGMKMSLIEPTAIKKIFTGKGNAKKAHMKEFLIKRVKSGEIKLEQDIEELSEHEIDGIAVGYTHWKISNQQPIEE